jgi:hypothetical protein
MGAHLLPKTGKENMLPTTATAQNIPAMANFLVFVFFMIKISFGFRISLEIKKRGIPQVAFPVYKVIKL